MLVPMQGSTQHSMLVLEWGLKLIPAGNKPWRKISKLNLIIS